MSPLFGVHRLSEQGMGKAREIAQDFDALLDRLVLLTDNTGSREFGICKMKLEEACFYAKKALAMNPANQEFEK